MIAVVVVVVAAWLLCKMLFRGMQVEFAIEEVSEKVNGAVLRMSF